MALGALMQPGSDITIRPVNVLPEKVPEVSCHVMPGLQPDTPLPRRAKPC